MRSEKQSLPLSDWLQTMTRGAPCLEIHIQISLVPAGSHRSVGNEQGEFLGQGGASHWCGFEYGSDACLRTLGFKANLPTQQASP